MAYLHIPNLYKSQDILLFKECYASEKIHGTSAHIKWKNKKINFFSGGTNHEKFVQLFNTNNLIFKFQELGHPEIIIYGEAYGGKCQGMSKTYGTKNRFVAFEVKIGNLWLDILNAEKIVRSFDLDFVPYEKCSTDLKILNELRDKPSQQAIKCGIIETPKKREGIVLRPLIEVTKNNGERIICKHKAEDFQETKTPRQVNSKDLVILAEANAIAIEWVTEMRLTHVLQKFPNADIEDTGNIIKFMIEDIEREAEGEIITSKVARKAISRETAIMFKTRLKNSLLLNRK